MSQPTLGRNDPCPCGSGKKYKKCHLPIDQEVARATQGRTTEEPGSMPDGEASPPRGGLTRNQIGLLLEALAIGVAVVLFVMGHWKWGVGVLGAGSLIAGMVWVAIDPPPPSDKKKNASGINFGQPS